MPLRKRLQGKDGCHVIRSLALLILFFLPNYSCFSFHMEVTFSAMRFIRNYRIDPGALQDSNPHPRPQQSGALTMSHPIFNKLKFWLLNYS